jgi:DNA polymerase-3 subunit gamma/tau
VRLTDPQAVSAAREAIAKTRTAGDQRGPDPRAAADADAHPDDPDVESAHLAGAELLERELGAQVIEEIRHQ